MSVAQLNVQPVSVLHQIRIELFSYEKGCLESYIENALDSIRRSHPTARFEPFNMLTFHRLIQFRTSTVISEAPAFGFFKLTIKLVQCSNPPELFFTCSFPEAPLFFPGCQQIVANHQNPDMEHTILNLNTSNGKLRTPPPKNTQEQMVILHQFSLNLLKENLSFAISPFEVWRQVECRHGYLSFPPNQSILAPLPDHQQPVPENYQRQPNNPGRIRKHTSFVVPPPPSQYGARGSWTVQNSQDWETVPYNPTDPNMAHLPFQRQHQKIHAPQPIVQPPS